MSFEIENGVLVEYTEEDGVTEVTIPKDVTSIDNYAFHFCTSLKSITIPESVTSIGECAFYNCTSLKSITIPDSVTSIGYSAFYCCKNITSITIPNSVISISDYTFYGCESLKSITIPDSVISIGYNAFSNCENLTSITISDSVTSIYEYAFFCCSSLTSITIPDSVKSIGYLAFFRCENLKSITIPDSINYIGDAAFDNTKIIICKGDVKVPFMLKGEWNEKEPEKLLNDFIIADVNKRKQYFDELKSYYKIPLALFMVFAYPQETYYPDYLKNDAEDAVKCLIDEEYIELLYRFLELGFVTKKNIDGFISYAVEHTQNGRSSEPQLVLSKYKNDNFDSNGADALDKFML